MKRWKAGEMLEIGKKLFAKIHKCKYHAHHNHEVHFMAHEMEEWIPQGVKAMIEGSYTPRPLKRFYFSDEMLNAGTKNLPLTQQFYTCPRLSRNHAPRLLS